MKKLLIILYLCCTQLAFGQEVKDEGIVTYTRQTFWAKIASGMKYLSAEEKDRIKLTWGTSDDGWKQKMMLYFKPTESLFTYGEDNEEDGGYSWRKEEYLIHRNFETERKLEVIEMLGKTYIVNDSLHVPNWKIMNQIKDINGYICMKAITEDTVKHQKIVAWFAQDIPIQAGPERYFGLPGLIMELDINDGNVILLADKIEFKKLTKETTLKKPKGKVITDREYDKILSDYIKETIKAYRNPFWGIRY
ncbi:GLPGLI family protein [Flectobacillus major]|jgi:GLPGLI family protein|uniref:GLPGLI family protein n=1 Tax=Flectobacillus major TaxID=103 RepID=UPI00047C5B99|nr:GLPGLI family protein [Flectobacillus major]